MVRVLLLTHGSLADSLLETVSLFVGDCEYVKGFNLGEEPETMRQNLRNELFDGTNTEFLILVDLFGGTPFNIAASLLPETMAAGKKVEIISGANLPMLAEVLSNVDSMTFQELKDTAVEFGKSGVRDLLTELNQQQ